MAQWWRPHTLFWNIPLSLLVVCFKVEPFYFQNAFYLGVREKGELCEKQTLSYSPSPGLKMTSWAPTTLDQHETEARNQAMWFSEQVSMSSKYWKVDGRLKCTNSGYREQVSKYWEGMRILWKDVQEPREALYLLNFDIEDTWLCLQGKKVETVKRVRQNK